MTTFGLKQGRDWALDVDEPDVVARMWAWQDYITICTTCLGNLLAAVALSPEMRPRLIERTRGYVRRGYETVAAWAACRDDVEVLPPDAAAICFVKYARPINSTEFVLRLVREKDAFVAPGDLFGLDGHLRVGFGLPEDYVRAGLSRVGELLDEIA